MARKILLLPEKSERLELIFYINRIIGLLGIIATANGRTATTGGNEINVNSLLAIIESLQWQYSWASSLQKIKISTINHECNFKYPTGFDRTTLPVIVLLIYFFIRSITQWRILRQYMTEKKNCNNVG